MCRYMWRFPQQLMTELEIDSIINISLSSNLMKWPRPKRLPSFFINCKIEREMTVQISMKRMAVQIISW